VGMASFCVEKGRFSLMEEIHKSTGKITVSW